MPKKKGRMSKIKKNYSSGSLSTNSYNRIYYVKRHVSFGNITLSNTAITQIAFSFRLADVPASSELTNLYDQYKICGVECKFYPKQTTSTNTTAIGADPVSFVTAVDYTDSSALSPDQLREYDSCKISCIFDTHTVYIKHPKCQLNTGQITDDWVATSSPTLSWFGLKAASAATNNSLPAFFYNMECKYYMCFKNIK